MFRNVFLMLAIAVAAVVPSGLVLAATTSWLNWDDIEPDNRWYQSGNWDNGVPNVSVDAVIPKGSQQGTVRIGSGLTGYANSLEVRGYFDLDTDYGRLYVDDRTWLHVPTGETGQPRLIVRDSGESYDFSTDDLDLYDGAELQMDGGIAKMVGDAEQSFIGSDSLITGNGTIIIAGELDLNGTLEVTGDLLTLQQRGDGTFDLDGGVNEVALSSTTINVEQADSELFVDGPVADAFEATINIGAKNKVTFNEGWILGTDGVLNMNGRNVTGEHAELAGSDSLIYGEINVTGRAKITSPVTFENGAEVSVLPRSGGPGILILSDSTTYKGGTFSAPDATISQVGDAVVDPGPVSTTPASFAIGDSLGAVQTFLWDGGGTSTTRVKSLKSFTINATQISDDPTTDGFDGTAILEDDATLIVNTAGPWRMEGTLIMAEGSKLGDSSAAKMEVGNRGGTATINVTGDDVYIGPEVEFEGTSEVIVGRDASLYLSGITTYQGGATMRGDGLLVQNGNAFVETGPDGSTTTIQSNTFNWDGDEMDSIYSTTDITAGATLLIDVEQLTDFYGTVNMNAARLEVTTPHAWRMGGNMTMRNSVVDGSDMIVGYASTGGTAILQINAGGFDSYSMIDAPVTFEDSAAVNVTANATLLLNNETTLQGTTYTIAGQWIQNGNASVDGDNHLDASTSGSTWAVDWDGGWDNLGSPYPSRAAHLGKIFQPELIRNPGNRTGGYDTRNRIRYP